MGAPDKICIHHVGGRGGSGIFGIPPSFSQDIVTVLYEADAEAKKAEPGSAGIVSLDYCIAGRPGPREFFVNYDPHTSSLLPPDREFKSFYQPTGMIDYFWSEGTLAARTITVDAVTLDDLTLDPAVPSPDVLTLDTQGSEIEILGGAKRLLSENILAVITEVEFQPMYENQPLFGEVSSFFRDAGFYFVGFERLGPGMMPYRAPSGLRGEGFLSYGDAIFLRRQEHVTSVEQRRKLAFLAIAFKQLEYGLMCLEGLPPLAAPKTVYERFINELIDTVGRHPRRFCPTYTQTYGSFEHSCNRTMYEPKFSARRESLKKIPGLVAAVRLVRSIPKRLRAAKAAAPTDVETLLMRYGFDALSAEVKRLRLKDDPWARPEPSA